MSFVYYLCLLILLNHQQSGLCSGDEAESTETLVASEANGDDVGARAAKQFEPVTPVNTVGLVRASVTLHCRVHSLKMPFNMGWSFIAEGSNSPVSIVHKCRTEDRYNDDYEVDKENNACNLVIDILRLDMAGTYTCLDRLSNASAKLIVLESDPICKSSVSEREILAGSAVTFTCSVRYSGFMAPHVEWTDEFRRILPSKSHHSNKAYVESSLVITAKVPILPPYISKTFFKDAALVSPGDAVHDATNNIGYSREWKSKAVRVKQSANANLALPSTTTVHRQPGMQLLH